MQGDQLLKAAKLIRILTLVSIYNAGSGHPGGALSSIDIITYLYSTVKNTRKDKLDFILSKGHSVPALYSTAAYFGLIDKKELFTLRKIGCSLQGHPHIGSTPWVGASTGSLAQGFSVAVGKALGFKYQKLKKRMYVLLGDGELQEGETWEAAMCAAHYRLDNLCAIVDYNKLQSDDLNENIMGLHPLIQKWEAFNWNVIEIDGHDFQQIESAFEKAEQFSGKPTVILAHTMKGRGVSFMEGSPLWHGSVAIKPGEMTLALKELGVSDTEIIELVSKNKKEEIQ